MLKRRPVYQYQPINTNPEQAIGIPLPFNKASHLVVDHFRSTTFGDASDYSAGAETSPGTVFGQTFSTEEQALSNLKNLLLTFRGERYMQPKFGTRIREILFDNNTDNLRVALENSLRADISYWLPYIEVRQLDMVSSQDGHQITMRLHFRVTDVGSNMVVNIMISENALIVTDATQDTGAVLTEIGSAGQGSVFDAGNLTSGFVESGTDY
tara:strand:- start:907 stop:1539 length:633 start_codon:yes stop_codon:yes gene_type:complete